MTHVSIEAKKYQEKITYNVNNLEEYHGWADAKGSAVDAIWLIQKITYNATNLAESITYADGVITFSKVWDDRATYTYS